MDSIEIKRLAAEVSVQHGIRIDPDHPMMAIVTLNRLMLEKAIGDALLSIRNAAEELNCAAERVQIRAGSVLAQEVRESVAVIRTEIQKDIDNAHVKASELVAELERRALSSSRWPWILTAGAAFFTLGFWAGTFVR
ncbi:MAG TPA: hypothetical protein VF283_16120 [Bryobacteraceae bacterium]